MSEQVQSILVPRHVAPTPEGAFDLVRSRGLDASVVEETAEGWLFRQAPACDCAPGIICDEDGCRVMRGPVCGCGSRKGTMNPILGEKAMRKQDDDEKPRRDDDEETVEKEEGDDEGEGEEEAEEQRQEAKLKAGAMWLRGLKAYCKAAEETVEQGDVLKTSKRCIKMGGQCARKVYKDHYKEIGYDDEDDGGESEEEEERPSDEEKAVINAFERAMQTFLQSTERFGKQLTRNGRKGR